MTASSGSACTSPTAEQLEQLGTVFGLHPLALEDAANTRQRPKIERYDDMLFLAMRTLAYVESDDRAEGGDVVETGSVMVFLAEHAVITVRHGRHASMSGLRRRLEASPELLASGPSSVLHAVADKVVDDYLGGRRRRERGHRGDRDATSSRRARRTDIERIYQLKRDVIEMKRTVGPLAAPLRELSERPRRLVHPEIREYFRDVEDHLARVREQVQSFDELLSSILQAGLARITVAENEDMRKISAWVAIAAVPTMIAGIYGMNFTHMPELLDDVGLPDGARVHGRRLRHPLPRLQAQRLVVTGGAPWGSITDVPGVRVGHATRAGGGWLTGVTVVLPPPGTVGAVDVRGGGPGTHETDALDPTTLVPTVDAVVLTGGSAYGLASAGGVQAWCEEQGRGVPVGPPEDPRRIVVPIVPAAAVFDLGRGGDPTGTAGRRPRQGGRRGGGRPRGGTGGARNRRGRHRGADGARHAQGRRRHARRCRCPGRPAVVVGALAVVNAAGSPVDPVTGALLGHGLRAAADSPGHRPPPSTARSACAGRWPRPARGRGGEHHPRRRRHQRRARPRPGPADGERRARRPRPGARPLAHPGGRRHRLRARHRRGAAAGRRRAGARRAAGGRGDRR